MSERRVDRVARILEDKDGNRAKVKDILAELRRVEGNSSLSGSALYIAIRSENDRLIESGQRPMFRTSKEGEAWGWVKLEGESEFVEGSEAERIEQQILEANKNVDRAIRERLENMDWREFESDFLTVVLEKLGFLDVEITQATRDGGRDARVKYKRGLVEASAVVSAKRWASRTPVPVEEVRLMRGIKGDEDTAIIITTSGFTATAQEEARPSQNQRVVYLIDGDRLVDICKRFEIGVRRVKMPDILTIDDLESSTEEAEAEVETEAAPAGVESPDEARSLLRFRDNMLDELTPQDIAQLTGLKESTVKTYLCIPNRRSQLATQIRSDKGWRAKALDLVATKRHFSTQ